MNTQTKDFMKYWFWKHPFESRQPWELFSGQKPTLSLKLPGANYLKVLTNHRMLDFFLNNNNIYICLIYIYTHTCIYPKDYKHSFEWNIRKIPVFTSQMFDCFGSLPLSLFYCEFQNSPLLLESKPFFFNRKKFSTCITKDAAIWNQWMSV